MNLSPNDVTKISDLKPGEKHRFSDDYRGWWDVTTLGGNRRKFARVPGRLSPGEEEFEIDVDKLVPPRQG